jgi:hypothetical protein
MAIPGHVRRGQSVRPHICHDFILFHAEFMRNDLHCEKQRDWGGYDFVNAIGTVPQSTTNIVYMYYRSILDRCVFYFRLQNWNGWRPTQTIRVIPMKDESYNYIQIS